MSEATGQDGTAVVSGVTNECPESYQDDDVLVTNSYSDRRTECRSPIPCRDILKPLYKQQSATTAGRPNSLVKGRPRSLVKSHGTLVRKKHRRDTATRPRRMLHGRLCVCVPRRRSRWGQGDRRRRKTARGRRVCPDTHGRLVFLSNFSFLHTTLLCIQHNYIHTHTNEQMYVTYTSSAGGVAS
jgi:hypothetical protein